MKSLIERLRTRRLFSVFVLLATISAVIVAGSFAAHGVRGQENQNDSSDATPLKVVNSPVAPNEFVKIAKLVGPAVVNINTQTFPKQSDNHGRRNFHGHVFQQPQDPNGGGDDQDQQQGQGQGQDNFQDFFNRFFGGQMPDQGGPDQGGGVQESLGSGFIVDPKGYIITNNHVVEKADKIYVKLSTDPDSQDLGRPARVIGTDKATDLAVIKIDTNTPLPTVKLGNSDTTQVGDWVEAIGSPFALSQTVTAGIISAKNRTIEPGASGQFQHFIQTDAAINPGNSGGPLVDAHGELIGINTFIITDSGSFAGAGFAIPSQIARSSAESIIKTGTVHHGYLGISMNDVTPDNASFFALPDASGAIVSQVVPDSPACRAGLKTGDVLRALNGKTIVNGSALQVAVTQIAPGNTIDLGILRNGKPETVRVQVGEYHAKTELADNNGPSSGQHARLGLAVADLTPDLRQQLNIPDHVSGAAIENVRPASPAEDAGLAPGDVILEVDRKPVQNADTFVSAVHAVPAGKDILLLVWSHGGASYRVVHPAQNSENGM